MLPYTKPADIVVKNGNIISEEEFNSSGYRVKIHVFDGCSQQGSKLSCKTVCGLDVNQENPPPKCIPAYVINVDSPHFALQQGDSEKICSRCLATV
jgi:hypothetical protein